MKKIPKIVRDIQNYKLPPIDWSKERVISHSQMVVHNQCSFRWSLANIDKIKIPNPNINLVYGIVIHQTIQSYLTTYFNISQAEADRMDLINNFKIKFKQEYKDQLTKNKDIHFSTKEELIEFMEDGILTLKSFKTNIKKYFSKKGNYLVGCEIPISHYILPNILYNGSLDIVIYNETINSIDIIDLKTSTRTWNDYQKKDEYKLSQLLLYKKIFAEQFNFPIDNISIRFIILKRKIPEDSDFHISRMQEFIVPSGKNKIGKAYSLLEDFAQTNFDDFGNIKNIKRKKNISENNCRFCQFNDKPQHCSRVGVFKPIEPLFTIF